MSNFIDRNSDDMKAYAKVVKDYAANMTQLIRTTQGALAFYESDLDDNSRSCIEKFNKDCYEFLKQVESYYQLANQIEKKANKQDEAKNAFKI